MSELKGFEEKSLYYLAGRPGRATGEAIVIAYKDAEAEVLSLKEATISIRDFDCIPYAVFTEEIMDKVDRLGPVLVAIDLSDLKYLDDDGDVLAISMGKYRIIDCKD